VVNSFHSRQRGEQTTAEIIAAGGRAVHVWGSVAQAAHLQNIFREIDSRFGGSDFLVSNAGNGFIAPLKDVRPEHLLKAFHTNVVALHQAAMLGAGLMGRRGGGKIVAISSIGAHLSFDYFGCNGTAKAALECLVRYLAVELAPHNIQVNAVSAGVIDGEWLRQFPDRPRFEAVVPRQRLNSEQEILEALLFLLTHGGTNGASWTADAGAGLCICEPISARPRTRTAESPSPQRGTEHVR
jgi:NAD(P)-dependent dehydrogenase (short-subunit alcohol dehydrogenase family)